MKRYINYTNLVGIALCLTIVILIKINRVTNQEFQISQFKIADQKRENLLLKSTTLLHGSCLQVKFKKSDIVTDLNDRPLTMENIIKKKTTIYRINETNCFTCIEKFLPELIKIGKKTNVIILGSYSESRSLFLALRNIVPKYIYIYNIKKETLSNERIEKLDMPYIFDIDTDLSTKNFFIPQKEIQKLSEFYTANFS